MAVRSLRLEVEAGPARGLAKAFGPGLVTMGRDSGQDLPIDDSAVSRQHLVLRLPADPGPDEASDASRGAHLLVEAIPGANPVWTLTGGERRVLAVGDVLALPCRFSFGASTIAARLEPAAPSSGSPAFHGGLEAGARATPDVLELDTTELGAPVPSRLAALAALGQRLSRSSSLQAVFRQATAWAIEALPATRALLLSPDGTDILAAATDGPALELAMSRGLLARVLREGRGFLIPNVMQEPDLAGRRSVQKRGIVGAMAAPASGLVFYAEWGPAEAVQHRYDDETLLLLACAAQLLSAFGDSARERSELRAASRVRRSTPLPMVRLIGVSAPIQRLRVFLERVAPSPATVLLHGESGTGKELAATAIHALSPRAEGPFLAINCAAIAPTLLESELFGHERGAFTGAVEAHEGVFARAHGGTLFLDEIGEMSLALQARMLRVLETRSFTRVGGAKEQLVDIRLVAATHRDLRRMVEEGTFREDLFYRLSVIHTRLPPLRERPEDIEPLVRHFADALGDQIGRRISSISPSALAALERYPWRGNVRELRNVLERAMVLGEGPTLDNDDLPPEILHARPPESMSAERLLPPADPELAGEGIPTLADLERRAITMALSVTRGNKARAAAVLGIDRTTLYRKLKELET